MREMACQAAGDGEVVSWWVGVGKAQKFFGPAFKFWLHYLLADQLRASHLTFLNLNSLIIVYTNVIPTCCLNSFSE